MRHVSDSSGILGIARFILAPTRQSNKVLKRLSRLGTCAVSLALIALLVALILLVSVTERTRSVIAFAESINTFASDDCTTPKMVWDLGQTACAVATGTQGQRRIAWVTPDGVVADISDPFSGTGTDTITFPTSGPFAQYGTWTVKTIDDSGSGFAVAFFLVLNAGVENADLVVSKFGPGSVFAGGVATYRIEILNRGPNVAQNVVLTEDVPNNSTFASEVQDSGPTAICANPSGTGSSTCTIPSLAPNERAIFTFVYNVASGLEAGTLILNTANVSSSTNELFLNDNTARYQTEVAPGAASPTCTITCPEAIFVDNSASDPNPCVKAVTYTTPVAAGGCADPDTGQIPTVVCSPPSGSDFPIGTSNVVCSTGATTCTFTITVNETRASVTPTITCPADVTASESSQGSGTAIVNYPAPSTTGNCVAVVCDPQSGSQFALGATTVNCTGTDSANNSVSCSFLVTVNVFTCGLQCPDDTTVNETSPGSGSAIVTFSNPTLVGTCPNLTIACSPPSGSSFPVGTTQVNCNATDESSHAVASCSFAVRVNSSSTCIITCPANVTAGENPSGSGSAVVNYSTPTSSGTCAADPVECNPPSGSTFPIGTTAVNCTRPDPNGNVATCSFMVTVTGGTPCTIACPPNVTQSSGGCGDVVTYPAPTTTGSCGDDPNPWSCSPPSGSFFPVGTTSVVCSTDVGTNCSFSVTITGSDETAPTIISCADAVFASADGCQAVVPNLTSAVVATDNCTPSTLLSVTQNPAPGTTVGIGTTTIILTVRDASNNSVNCSTTLTVFEVIPPNAVCRNITVALSASGTASIAATDVDNGSSDNCGIAARTVTPNTFTCADRGANNVTLTVTDTSGNSATCQATVTVVDNIPPAISCPANIVVEPTCPAGAVVTFTPPVGTDNCGGSATIQTAGLASGSTFPIGVTTNTFTVTDTSGNFVSCSFTVRVKTVAEVIQDLITRVQALQPPLSGQQSQGLVSKLQAALDAVNEGKPNVACNKLADFINQVTGYINNGTLTSAQGQPLIDSAARIRNTLGCTNLGCT